MTDMTDMKRFNSHKQRVTAKPMTRLAYNDLRGWELPVDECGADDGYLVVDINADSNFDGYDGHVSWKPKALFENQYYEVDAALFADVDDSVEYDDSDDDAQYTDETSVCGYGVNGSTRQGLSLDQELMRETIALISPKYADSRTKNMLDDANTIVSAIMGRDSQACDAPDENELLAERISDVLGVQVEVTGEFVPCATAGMPAIVNYIKFDGTNDSEVMEFFDGHSGIEGDSFAMSNQIYLSDDTGMHMGKVGDYLVKYSDGSIKLSETCPIDNGASLLSTADAQIKNGTVTPTANRVAGVNIADSFDFGLAIHCLKNGKKVARAGWNGKGMYVYYVPAASYPVERNNLETMGGIFPDDMVPYREYLALKTAQNDVATWTPSVSDALATDWQIV